MEDNQQRPVRTLQDLETYMHQKGRVGWVLVEKAPTMLRFEKQQAGQNGSALVALLLLFLGIIPGILYMVYGRKPAVTYRLTVTQLPDGALQASGDGVGCATFNRFLDPAGAHRRDVLRVLIALAAGILFVWALVASVA